LHDVGPEEIRDQQQEKRQRNCFKDYMSFQIYLIKKAALLILDMIAICS